MVEFMILPRNQSAMLLQSKARQSLQADVFEAYIGEAKLSNFNIAGALFLDQGLETVAKFCSVYVLDSQLEIQCIRGGFLSKAGTLLLTLTLTD